MTLSVEQGPRHGRVLLVVTSRRQNGAVRESNLTSVTSVDLRDPAVRLVYRHDGTETASDEFVLALSQDLRGSGQVRSETTTCHVTVLPVNDARPALGTSSLVRVPLGGSAVITSANLRAVDDDSDDQQVR